MARSVLNIIGEGWDNANLIIRVESYPTVMIRFSDVNDISQAYWQLWQAWEDDIECGIIVKVNQAEYRLEFRQWVSALTPLIDWFDAYVTDFEQSGACGVPFE